MRVVATVQGPAVPAQSIHRPARAVGYAVLAEADAGAAEEVHDSGWGGRGRRPWSVRPPLELTRGAGAARIEIATPLDVLGELFATGLASMTTLRWGAARLEVKDIDILRGSQDERRTDAEWRSATPVIAYGPPPRREPLIPGEPGWAGAIRASISSAARWLGVEAPQVAAIRAGRRVLVQVAAGRLYAAASRVSLDIAGNAAALSALAEMGVGARGIEGFGWVETTGSCVRAQVPA